MCEPHGEHQQERFYAAGWAAWQRPYNWAAMSNPIQIEQITERVERLLLRYEELQRTNALLTDQVSVLTHERDSLQSRLSAARSRVEALLERLPDSSASSPQPAKTSSGTGR